MYTDDLPRYYINHVTKTNTWAKPTLPANASNTITSIPRPSIPPATRSAPTVPKTDYQSAQRPPPQVSLRSPNVPTNQRVALPYQPKAPGVQQASIQQHATLQDPRPTYQQAPTPVSSLDHGALQPRPSYAARPTSGANALPSNQAASPQIASKPLQPLGAAVNRPYTSNVGSQQTIQQSSPSNQIITPQASRPTLSGRIFSAPATTSAMNAASNMGSRIRESVTALARNPDAQQVAVTLGRVAVQAALSDGDSTSAQGLDDSVGIFTSVSGPVDISQSSDIVISDQTGYDAAVVQMQDANNMSDANYTQTSSAPMQAATYSNQSPTTYILNTTNDPSTSVTVPGDTYNGLPQTSPMTTPPPAYPTTATYTATPQISSSQSQTSTAPQQLYQSTLSPPLNQNISIAQANAQNYGPITSPTPQPGPYPASALPIMTTTMPTISDTNTPTQTIDFTTYTTPTAPPIISTYTSPTPFVSSEPIDPYTNTTTSMPPTFFYPPEDSTLNNDASPAAAFSALGNDMAQVSALEGATVNYDIAAAQEEQLLLQEEGAQNALALI